MYRVTVPPTNPNAADDSEPPIRIEHRFDSETPASIAIVRVIAAIEDVDPMDSPTDLGITLYDHIDPTALDRLVRQADGRGDVSIEFTIRNGHRYSVGVRDTGHLIVEKDV